MYLTNVYFRFSSPPYLQNRRRPLAFSTRTAPRAPVPPAVGQLHSARGSLVRPRLHVPPPTADTVPEMEEEGENGKFPPAALKKKLGADTAGRSGGGFPIRVSQLSLERNGRLEKRRNFKSISFQINKYCSGRTLAKKMEDQFPPRFANSLLLSSTLFFSPLLVRVRSCCGSL